MFKIETENLNLSEKKLSDMQPGELAIGLVPTQINTRKFICISEYLIVELDSLSSWNPKVVGGNFRVRPLRKGEAFKLEVIS